MAKLKKLPNEALLLKEAIRIGMIYAEKRGVVEFEATDSAHLKVEFIYRLLSSPDSKTARRSAVSSSSLDRKLLKSSASK